MTTGAGLIPRVERLEAAMLRAAEQTVHVWLKALSDEQLEQLLAVEGGAPFGAAAGALLDAAVRDALRVRAVLAGNGRKWQG